MKAVIYARYSSHNQNEQSIEGQLKVCHDYAKRNNLIIINEYIDRALTGTNDNRPQFQKMIEDSKGKKFETVLVYQLDRFARDVYDSAHYECILQKNGVKVLSANENLQDNPSGRFMKNVLIANNQYYSEELALKIKRGMDLKAQKCLYTGGSVALGYKVDNKGKFDINETTAFYVRQIFEMYADGKTIAQINEYLNSQQMKTIRGANFNKNSLRKLLQNKRYIGIFTYNDLEIPNGIPRIIPDDLFYRVQDKMKANKKAPARARAKEEYLLTTKLFCGYCKSMMTGLSAKSHTGKKYFYYTCNKAKVKECNKKKVKKSYIENLVIDQCRELLTVSNMKKIAKVVAELFEKDVSNIPLLNLKKCLKDNEKKQTKIMESLMECDIENVRKALYAELNKLVSDKQEIEKQIIVEEKGIIKLSESEILFFLSKLKNGNVNDIKYRRMLINVFVNEIYLFDDKVTLILNVGDKNVTIDEILLNKIDDFSKSLSMSILAPPMHKKPLLRAVFCYFLPFSYVLRNLVGTN